MELITHNKYDELGQLINKKVGRIFNSIPERFLKLHGLQSKAVKNKKP